MTTRDSVQVHVVAYALWPSSPAHDADTSHHPWVQALQALPMQTSLQILGDACLSSAVELPANPKLAQAPIHGHNMGCWRVIQPQKISMHPPVFVTTFAWVRPEVPAPKDDGLCQR
ncbi:MAG: hypothetical protein ACKO69_08380, partial [Limnohabitans sp.]